MAEGSVGRPTHYNIEIASEICARLSSGRSLRSVCRDEDMPSERAVFLWLAKHEDFVQQYARAREAQADALFDEALDIADNPQIGIKTVTKATGVEVTEADMIDHRRLRVDTRKWLVGKLSPKKYGDKTQLEHFGKDGGPIQVAEYTDEQRVKALANLIARTKAQNGE